LFYHVEFIEEGSQHLKEETLRRTTTRIVNEVDDASRCAYNLMDKSSATIEHE
jgi:GMP synthase PP-ATPase subunit